MLEAVVVGQAVCPQELLVVGHAVGEQRAVERLGVLPPQLGVVAKRSHRGLRQALAVHVVENAAELGVPAPLEAPVDEIDAQLHQAAVATALALVDDERAALDHVAWVDPSADAAREVLAVPAHELEHGVPLGPQVEPDAVEALVDHVLEHRFLAETAKLLDHVQRDHAVSVEADGARRGVKRLEGLAWLAEHVPHPQQEPPGLGVERLVVRGAGILGESADGGQFGEHVLGFLEWPPVAGQGVVHAAVGGEAVLLDEVYAPGSHVEPLGLGLQLVVEEAVCPHEAARVPHAQLVVVVHRAVAVEAGVVAAALAVAGEPEPEGQDVVEQFGAVEIPQRVQIRHVEHGNGLQGLAGATGRCGTRRRRRASLSCGRSG